MLLGFNFDVLIFKILKMYVHFWHMRRSTLHKKLEHHLINNHIEFKIHKMSAFCTSRLWTGLLSGKISLLSSLCDWPCHACLHTNNTFIFKCFSTLTCIFIWKLLPVVHIDHTLVNIDQIIKIIQASIPYYISTV